MKVHCIINPLTHLLRTQSYSIYVQCPPTVALQCPAWQHACGTTRCVSDSASHKQAAKKGRGKGGGGANIVSNPLIQGQESARTL